MSGLFPAQFYAKVAAACFVVGAGMELVMLHTGFYDKWVPCLAEASQACQGQDVEPDAVKALLRSCRALQIEAERLEEGREDREAFMQQFRTEIERQASEKHLHIHFPDEKG